MLESLVMNMIGFVVLYFAPVFCRVIEEHA